MMTKATWIPPAAWPRRTKLLAGAALAFILITFHLSPMDIYSEVKYRFSRPSDHQCSPRDYSDGTWVYKPKTSATKMTSMDDAVAFSGFERCASSREYYWHLASDTESQWDRFPAAHNYEWVPGRRCSNLRPMSPAEMVKDLVEGGGWYLVGDSVTENHFFSLSCLLGPHVIATPTYTPNTYFDRGWPQKLFLNPNSSIIPSLTLPKGFNISSTPLVIFRRIDILFSQPQLVEIHKETMLPTSEHSNPNATSIFSDEGVWTLSPEEYIKEFLAPLPEAHYTTMVVSTAGHWTTTTFNNTRPATIQGVLTLFENAMSRWIPQIQSAFQKADEDERQQLCGGSNTRICNNREKAGLARSRDRTAVIRAYLPGHEDCRNQKKPHTTVQPYTVNWYNWNEIKDFNAIWEKLLTPKTKYPNVHYLPIDHPGRLRPDAHATGDCLHIMSGAGVLEGWSHYIWHFVTRELAGGP